MIDWVRVAELRSEIGADSFAEVADLFLEEADEAIARLSGSPAPESIEGSLHFLKGSALNLGFSDLATLCHEGERTAAVGAPQDVDLAQVRHSYALSKQEFLRGIARLSAA